MDKKISTYKQEMTRADVEWLKATPLGRHIAQRLWAYGVPDCGTAFWYWFVNCHNAYIMRFNETQLRDNVKSLEECCLHYYREYGRKDKPRAYLLGIINSQALLGNEGAVVEAASVAAYQPDDNRATYDTVAEMYTWIGQNPKVFIDIMRVVGNYERLRLNLYSLCCNPLVISPTLPTPYRMLWILGAKTLAK